MASPWVASRPGRVTLLLLLLLALAGCLGPRVDATPAQAERLTLALVRALRLHHDLHAGAPPAPDELRAAWDDLRARLADLEVAPVGTGVDARAVEAARDVLLAHEVVFLPPAVPSTLEVDLALARVTARRAGLARELLGRPVRWRRVEHEGLLLPDVATHAALRAGRPWPLPLARRQGLTVYVDRLAVERRAGRGAAAHLTPDALAAQAELREVAALRLEDDLLAGADPARFFAAVLLLAAAEGDARYGLAEIERIAEEPDPDLRRTFAAHVRGAALAREALADEDPALLPAERARRALARLRRP
ncbi:MAG: hypothetical protein M9894_34290 [Planctomycetes bacterium]|nr:hypothetical protein [Planctomycetota bacterium]